MVSHILIVGAPGEKLHSMFVFLKKKFHTVHVAKNFEHAFKIVRKYPIDVVLFKSQDGVENFFPLFRELCKIIPIIGIIEDYDRLPEIELDDVVTFDYSYEAVLRKINIFSQIRNLFESDIAENIYLSSKFSKKIALLLHDDSDIIDQSRISNVQIVTSNSISSDVLDSDIFIINCEKNKAKKYAAEIRLMDKKRPIIFTYHSKQKPQFFNVLWDIGCTDIVPDFINRRAFAYEINSLIKFKKMHELFTKKIKEQSYCSIIDTTTGVYNRSFLEGYIKKHACMMTGVAVFMIDVDKFKSVNDKFGHAFADIALGSIAKIIKKYIRSSDVVARYGGDEFIIIMHNITQTTAADVANRIQSQIAGFRLNDARFSVSIGVCYRSSCMGLKEAISVADEVMYVVKQSGGNAVKMCN